MTKPTLKSVVRECVSRWAGKHARQSDRLDSLKRVTRATKRTLAREINTDSRLAPCSPLIEDEEINAGQTVSELGDCVWNNKMECISGL